MLLIYTSDLGMFSQPDYVVQCGCDTPSTDQHTYVRGVWFISSFGLDWGQTSSSIVNFKGSRRNFITYREIAQVVEALITQVPRAQV